MTELVSRNGLCSSGRFGKFLQTRMRRYGACWGRAAGSPGPFEQRAYHDDSIGRGCFTSGPADCAEWETQLKAVCAARK